MTEKYKRQLEEYFVGKRKIFNIELDIIETEFQKLVWNLLLKIFYEKTSLLNLEKKYNK